MGVVFDEVIANVETPREAPPPEATPAQSRPNDSEEIINAVEIQQRRARRLQAD